MQKKARANCDVGQIIGPMKLAPVDRMSLALYCGASNDHNRIHIDPDRAREAGLDDVIAHGMLSMAYVGRLLTSWTDQTNVRSFSCRFVGMMTVGDIPVVSGEVVERFRDGGGEFARLSLSLKDSRGEEKIQAQALVKILEN